MWDACGGEQSCMRTSVFVGVIHIDDMAVTVTRKAIRTLRLRVCPPHAEVRVSVPWHMAQADVLRFVRSKEAWIRGHRERILAARPAPLLRILDGERVPLWGREHVLRVERGAARMAVVDGAILLRVPDESDPELCARVLDRGCRKLLLERAQELAEHWSSAMGVPLPELRVRSMRTRWGSCNPRARRVWLNIELARRAPECLEYVVVHELAHLLERGHTARFTAILDQHLPHWRQVRRMLNAG